MKFDPSRRLVLAGAATLPLALAGCGTTSPLDSAGGTVLAEAPAYRVGDRWAYRIDPRFRASPSFDEIVEITAAGADGIVVRVASQVVTGETTRTERWSAPGLVLQGALLDVETRRFREPLQRLRFPLASGERWNQWVDQVNETAGTSGPINRYVSVQRTEPVTTPAGTFDAVRMTVIMRLDDETPFRFATECTHLVWYAPAVRGVVREERRAHYREKGSGIDAMAWIPVQNEVVQLSSFTPGR